MTGLVFPDDPAFDPDTRKAVGIGYAWALERLRLNEKTDLASELVAAKIMSIAHSGVRDPEQLCDCVVEELIGQP